MNTASYLPLTETTLYILLSLAGKPKHGYAILKEVQALSEGRITLSTGTLYGALKRLLENGWIQRQESETAPNNERPRKVYRLTKIGRRVLQAELGRLNKLVKLGEIRTASERV
jgi:DNA-binding PadR family transcriptional regulator